MDSVQDNIRRIAELFPNCVVEHKNANGELEYAINFEALQQELSSDLVNGQEERYNMQWPDKRKAKLLANAPINATLRPCREESVDFDNTKNLYIEGDNLDILKCLKETYYGKLDVIYIDPPYNTGTDILYSNDYSDSVDEFGEKYEVDAEGYRKYTNSDTNGRYHTNWMNMMYERLLVARNLLKETGFLLVAIDHYELFNLGEICDEIFGYVNRIGVITVVHKPEGRNQAKFIGPSNEFMLIYAKNQSVAKLQKVVLDEELSKAFGCTDEQGAYRLKNFIRLADGKYATRESKPTFWYPIYVSPDLKTITDKQVEGYYEVFPVTTTGVERTWKTTKDTFIERNKNGDFVAQNEDGMIVIYEKLREDQVIRTHWIDKKYHGYHFGTKLLDDLLGVKTFDSPKSLYLMRDIVKLFSPKDALILDFFSGSATTAHATMLVNAEDNSSRRFIMCQIPAACDAKSEAYKAGYKNICEIGKERIRRAGKKVKESAGLLANSLDTGFRVLKLDSTNMQDVYYAPADLKQEDLFAQADNIKPDRNGEDLLFQVMLDLGILLDSKIEKQTIAGKQVFNVANNFLLACFDSEVNDEVITAIAKQQPQYAVLRDSSYLDDSTATNFEQLFRTYSPNTTIKTL